MKTVTYIYWTEPGEKEKFENCVKTTHNDEDLKEKLQKEFEINAPTAFMMIRKFEKFIKNNRK